MGLLEILGLNLGNLNVSVSLGQRSALYNDAVLHGRAPTLLSRDAAALGLRDSVITARNIVEETIKVPTPELEDILAKLRDLESQVEDLLGDSEDAVEVTTTTENAQEVDDNASEAGSIPAADDNEAEDEPDVDEAEENNTENGDTGASNAPESIPGGGIFMEKVQVETEVVTSTMDDTTSTITMTRTMTETVTIQPESPVQSTPEAAPADSSTISSEPETPVPVQTPNVRLGGAFKEADQPFSASNATAVQMNAAQLSDIPGEVISAPPTSLPVPAVKQFHQALYTNSSVSSGFQTVTLPGAQ